MELGNGVGNDVDTTPKLQATKAKMDIRDYMKLKTINKVTSNAKQEKMFVSHITEKKLISKMYKQVLLFTNNN